MTHCWKCPCAYPVKSVDQLMHQCRLQLFLGMDVVTTNHNAILVLWANVHSYLILILNLPLVLSIIISHSTLCYDDESFIQYISDSTYCLLCSCTRSVIYHMLILATNTCIYTSTNRQVIPRRRLSLFIANIACSNLATLGDVSRMRPSSTVHFPSVYLHSQCELME